MDQVCTMYDSQKQGWSHIPLPVPTLLHSVYFACWPKTQNKDLNINAQKRVEKLPNGNL